MKHNLWEQVTERKTMRFMGRLLRYKVIGLTLVIGCLLSVPGEAGQQKRYTVLIDPAHGGEDAGVIADKIREKDITMNLALLIRGESQKVEGLQVRLTRSTDRTVSVAERMKAVGDSKPDCLISLHVNAGFGRQASGYEVYFPGFKQNVPREEGSSPVIKDMAKNRSLNDSVRLAQHLQAGLETVFPRKGRGLRDAACPLLQELTIPGLVVEVGFATNPDERKKLTGEEVQRAVARALVKGLREYFRKAP